jgi:disulfide bond formation protein DsbB
MSRGLTGEAALTAAWVVALVATLSVLFIGEVLGQMPCLLCWYQRAFMFPLPIVLGLGLWWQDARVGRYGLALSLLGGAVALLHLIEFEEPFGLSVAESMVAGTPVIAFARGSMPELVRPGLSGALVADVAEAVAAVRVVGRLDRSACRTDAIARFSADRMVDDYARLFEQVAGGGGATNR